MGSRSAFISALAVSLAAGLLTSCMSTAPAGRSTSLDSYWAATGKSYAAQGQATKPMAWKPGQYVVVGTTTNGNHNSVSKTLLVREEQGGWVIETSSTSSNGEERVSQMLITGIDQAMASGDSSGIDVQWIKTLKDGKVSTMEGAQLGMMKGLYSSAYQSLVVSTSGASDGGSVTVPAGSFDGTTTIKATTKVMLSNVETQSWLHPAVPVNGMVKSMTTDGKTVVELLSFGFDGTPRIPES